MYRQVVRLGVAVVGGVALAVGAAQLGVGVGVQAGEAVPDHVAAALRGGDDCIKQSKTSCVDGPNPDQLGKNCLSEPVYDYDKNADPYKIGSNLVYCGGTKLNCGRYFNDLGDKCSTTAITAPAGAVAP